MMEIERGSERLARKWAALGVGAALPLLGCVVVAAGGSGASFLPEITGSSSSTGGDLVFLLIGALLFLAMPFAVAAASGRSSWAAAGLVAAAAGLVALLVAGALVPDGRAAGHLGLGLGAAVAVALHHRSRAETAARAIVLGAYLVVLAVMGPDVPSLVAVLVLPGIGLADMVASRAST